MSALLRGFPEVFYEWRQAFSQVAAKIPSLDKIHPVGVSVVTFQQNLQGAVLRDRLQKFVGCLL